MKLAVRRAIRSKNLPPFWCFQRFFLMGFLVKIHEQTIILMELKMTLNTTLNHGSGTCPMYGTVRVYGPFLIWLFITRTVRVMYSHVWVMHIQVMYVSCLFFLVEILLRKFTFGLFDSSCMGHVRV